MRVDEAAKAFGRKDGRTGYPNAFGKRAIGGRDADLVGPGIGMYKPDDFIVGGVRGRRAGPRHPYHR